MPVTLRLITASFVALMACTAACGSEGGASGVAPILWSDVEYVTDATVDTPDAEEGPEAYGLPLLSIVGSASELSNIHERYEEEITIEVDLTLGERTWTGVRLELHGGFARTVPKKSYRLVFPDEDQLEGDLFGDGSDDKLRRLVLQASWIDRSFLRNKLTMDLVRELDGLSPRIGYVILVINGEWLGLYQAIERVDRPFLDRAKLDKDGNLYKAESHWANWKAKADPLAGYDIQEGKDNEHDDLGDLLDALTHTPLTLSDFEAEVAPRLALEDFTCWQMVHTLAMNEDTYTKNYYLYHDVDAAPDHKESRFRIISWDADATWGNSWDGTVLEPTKATWHGTDAFSPRLFAISTYRADYVTRYLDALDGPLSAPVIGLRIAAITSRIHDAAEADLARWEPEADFGAEIARLESAVATRTETMLDLLEALEADL